MATYTGKVRGGSLNMRQTCSTSATRLASIPNDTNLSVQTVSGQNDWFQTTYSGQTGYVAAQYIAVTSGVGTCTVTTQSGPLNIRKTPSTSATAIYTAAKGSTLYLLDTTSVSGWYRVSGASGTGWASSTYLTPGSTGGDIGGGDDTYPIAATVETAKHGNGGTLNLRQSASSGAQLVTTIPNGATIYVKSLTGEWLAAKYNTYTGYVMAKFVVGTEAYNGSAGGDVVTPTGSVYATVCTTNSTLSASQRLANVQYIYAFLCANGFTKEAACGVLGNMESESQFNPGIWQSTNNLSKGYGVVQWTPATVFLDYAKEQGILSAATAAATNALANSDAKTLMDTELACLLYCCTTRHDFFKPSESMQHSGYSMTFSQYKASTLPAETLGVVFHDHYERSSGTLAAVQKRGTQAQNWYQQL